MIKIIKKQKGIVMMFVLLIMSVILLLSFTIADIIISQISFSRFSGESLRAFYAADSGAECAFYWDFITRNDFRDSIGPPLVSYSINCANTAVSQTMTDLGAGKYFTSFNMPNFTNGACVTVEINKDINAVAPSYGSFIEAFGYNESCASANPTKVERAIELDY